MQFWSVSISLALLTLPRFRMTYYYLNVAVLSCNMSMRYEHENGTYRIKASELIWIRLRTHALC